jgi:hypothetical protein
MTDLAPWERDPESGRQDVEDETDAPYELPPDDALPDIYRAEASEFIARPGPVVQRPETEPRRMAPRGLMLLAGLHVFALLGIAAVLAAILGMANLGGVLGWGVGVTGAVVFGAALILLIIELNRYLAFSRRSFFPAVLVFGTLDQFEAVVGPGGLQPLAAHRIKGVGRGPLNRLFDPSAHIASPPEMVALHYDRGSGPELVAVEWSAVNDHKRGEVVWLSMVGAGRYLMYHLLIPYAPHVVMDDKVRREIYTALKVGGNMFRELPRKQEMGTAKVLHTNEDGKIVTGNYKRPQGGDPNDTEVPLAADIGARPAPDEFDADDGYEDTEVDGPPMRLVDPGAPLVNRNDPDDTDENPNDPDQEARSHGPHDH